MVENACEIDFFFNVILYLHHRDIAIPSLGLRLRVVTSS